MRRILLATMLAIFAAEPLLAEMYKYTDSRGEVHYVDDLGRVPKRYRAKARTLDDLPPISVMDAVPPPAKKRPAADSGSRSRQTERFSGTVELYMTSWCGYCRKAEQYLKQKGIDRLHRLGYREGRERQTALPGAGRDRRGAADPDRRQPDTRVQPGGHRPLYRAVKGEGDGVES